MLGVLLPVHTITNPPPVGAELFRAASPIVSSVSKVIAASTSFMQIPPPPTIPSALLLSKELCVMDKAPLLENNAPPLSDDEQ